MPVRSSHSAHRFAGKPVGIFAGEENQPQGAQNAGEDHHEKAILEAVRVLHDRSHDDRRDNAGNTEAGINDPSGKARLIGGCLDRADPPEAGGDEAEPDSQRNEDQRDCKRME